MQAADRDRVGLLCDQLSRWPSLTATIRDGGAETELHDLLALLSNQSDPDSQQVSELIEAIERACARQGLTGLTHRNGGSPGGITALPPGMTGAPEVVGWTCPLSQCNRVVTPEETSHPPACAAVPGPDGRMKPYPPTAR
ncbi:hypothetical protein ABZU94_39035 [Streptomyces mirabilis]|uniref:hypothetical protein n=1 Tax=Streptomyces sp. NPDC005388 TaxID=3156717 RepID=UPI0033AF6535